MYIYLYINIHVHISAAMQNIKSKRFKSNEEITKNQTIIKLKIMHHWAEMVKQKSSYYQVFRGLNLYEPLQSAPIIYT